MSATTKLNQMIIRFMDNWITHLPHPYICDNLLSSLLLYDQYKEYQCGIDQYVYQYQHWTISRDVMFIWGDTIKFRTDIEGSQTLLSGFHIDVV